MLEKSSVYKSKIDTKLLSDKLFPLLASGFSDPHPGLRESTLKTCIFLSDKLTETTINQELIKNLGRLQSDEQPGIRTNTMIAIGKLTKNLKPAVSIHINIRSFMYSNNNLNTY